MNHFFKRTLFFISFIGCLVISCRKEKSQPPEINIIEPSSGANYQIYDTIHIMAQVNDDNEIAKLTCSVLNYLNTPVLPVQNFKVNHTNYTIDFYIVINNIEIPTGNYKLMIFASDGESDVRAWQTVTINECPRQRESVYISAADNSSVLKVFKIDSTETPFLVITVPGDFSGTSMSTKYKQYYIAGNYTGNLITVNTQNQAVDWSIANNANSGAPYFTNINSDKEIVYVSRYDGKIIGYDHFGSQKYFAETDMNNFPGLILPVDNRLLTVETSILNGSKNLLIYSKPAGSALFKIPINFEVKRMVEKNVNEVYIIGTGNSSSEIYLLDMNTAMLDLRLSLTTFLVMDATAVNEYVLILSTDIGLYEFNNNSSSLVPLVTGYVTNLVKYDEIENEVYAVHGKTLDVYGYQLHSLVPLNSFQFSDTINSINFLYNREKFN